MIGISLPDGGDDDLLAADGLLALIIYDNLNLARSFNITFPPEQIDLVPFEACIESGVAGMMLSHIIYKKIDPQWPASLSQRVAEELLRERMRFSGITMTDDLDMGAIHKHYEIKTAIRQILLAGIDITLICHKGPNIEIAYQEILQNLSDSPELKAKGVESVQRIMDLKKKYLGALG